ncbi:12811_t:CDS:2 [Ambispora gerdemannii]|uniref:12811_t:CDS:1 n=1 Tax=Ambispora gerdemannii TaxID=144530 RepID=A0A9N8Z134_9GLOM|nr:12811_t:CDS:2 [Ambispora gerdemannii]
MNREQYQGPSAPQQKATQQMHYLCAGTAPMQGMRASYNVQNEDQKK